MLFGAYVTTSQNVVDERKSYKLLAQHLGYDPVFCFKADSARNAIFGSIMIDITMPEKLVLFESDDYQRIDIVQWNRFIADIDKNDSADIRSCFTNMDDAYCMFVVQSIQNPIVSIDIKDAMFMRYDDNTEWRGFFGELLTQAQDCALSICKNVTPKVEKDVDWHAYANVQHMIIKEAFQGCLLPLIYPVVLGRSLPRSTYFNYLQYLKDSITNDTALFFDLSTDVNQKTYDQYRKIVRKIRACMSKTYDTQLTDGYNQTDSELGPNSICPCGSGKKYKKCCKNSGFDLM